MQTLWHDADCYAIHIYKLIGLGLNSPYQISYFALFYLFSSMGLDRRARAFFKTTHNMADTLIQMAMADDVNIVNAILRMLLSLLLGAIVGIERMIKGQTAGMRTFALLSLIHI